MNAISVVLADDDAGMRAVMRKMIERVEGFSLAGEADNGLDLLKLVEEKHPQVVFLDVEMPGMTGVECARIIQDTEASLASADPCVLHECTDGVPFYAVQHRSMLPDVFLSGLFHRAYIIFQ